MRLIHKCAASLVMAAGALMPVSFAAAAGGDARWDFNGDGSHDLAVGAPGHCEWGQGFLGIDVELCDVGRVQVYDGARIAAGQSSPQEVIRVPGMTVETRLGDVSRQYTTSKWKGSRMGEALASGDFNGDGVGDLAVGLPGFDDGKGLVHIHYGRRFPSGSTIGFAGPSGLTQASAAGQAKVGGARFGAALAVGDFNADGVDDLAVGAPGDTARKVIVFTGVAGASLSGSGAHVLSSVYPDDRFGQVLAGGDLNSDGVEDLAIGAPGENGGQGSVRVLYGTSTGITTLGQQKFVPNRPSAGLSKEFVPLFGSALTVGDVNADGAADLVIGAPGQGSDGYLAYPATEQSKTFDGRVTVLHSRDGNAKPTDVGQFVLSSQFTGGKGRFGFTVAVGRFNGDGAEDLAVGVPDRSVDVAVFAGMVEVFHGVNGTVPRFAGALRQGGTTGVGDIAEKRDRFGYSIAARRFHTDRTDCLVVGVPGEDSVGRATVLIPASGAAIPALAGRIEFTVVKDGEGFNDGSHVIDDVTRAGAEFGSSIA